MEIDKMASAKQVLIIDDNADYVELLKAILVSRGYTVFDAGDGEEGLVMLKKIKPDLIILDINMPKMDGMEFYKRICTRYGRTKFPVLISSAREELAGVFKEIAVDGFIPKPFKIEDMLHQVDQLSSGARDPLVYLLAPKSHSKVRELEKAIREERFNIEVVEDLEFLKNKLAVKSPQVLIMEYVQRESSAEEILKMLRRMPGFQRLPIIVYSHSGFPGIQQKALSAGADHFVMEPSNMGEFIHAINTLLRP